MRFARLICGVALLAALPLRAETRALLHEPREGAELRGGTTATLAWEWSSAKVPRFAEEWEAFLSVDGGKYYAYRITPHLEIAQRRFTFEVPNVETANARILLRTGDERREVEIELPVTFTIHRDRFQELDAGATEVRDASRGEAARPGDKGVIQWIDGDRSGKHLVARSALQHDNEIRDAAHIEEKFEIAEAAGWLPVLSQPAATSRIPIVASTSTLHSEPRCRDGRDVLLVCRRLNI